MSDGFVYFIQEEGTHKIKIGFSEKHPNGRLKDFQTGNSNKLNLLGYIEGTYEDESKLHREFNEERGNGEWFEPSPRLNDRIKELLEESLEDKKSGIEDLNLQYKEEEKERGVLYQHIVFNREQNRSLKEWSRSEGLTEKYWLKYVGEIKNGVPNGQGTSDYGDGEGYEGEWKDGEQHGQGTLIWGNNKYMYVGGWKDGEKHGHGTTTFPDGRVYEGEWKDGKEVESTKTKEGDKNYEHNESGNEVRISYQSVYENRFKKPESLVNKIIDLFK
jgi:hypothetical protein